MKIRSSLIHTGAMAALLGALNPRFVGHYGPRVFASKNVGRNWLKGAGGRIYPYDSTKARARFARQIAEGRLKPENGLVIE